MKFLQIEISYDCVVIEEYRARTKRSYAGNPKSVTTIISNYLRPL